MDNSGGHVTTWRDRDGNDYPWMTELWRWQDERKMRGESSTRRLSDIPPARLSDLLRCLDKALATPEIMERVRWYASRPHIDPADLRLDDPRQAEADRQQVVIGFMSRFAAWFRMQNAIDDNPGPYGNILLILAAMSKGQVDRSDTSEMRRMFGPYFTVDDLG